MVILAYWKQEGEVTQDEAAGCHRGKAVKAFSGDTTYDCFLGMQAHRFWKEFVVVCGHDPAKGIAFWVCSPKIDRISTWDGITRTNITPDSLYRFCF